MGTLVPIVPTRTGALSAGAAVAASDVIPAAVLGARGAYLEIINGGGSVDNITITDFGTTPALSPLPANAYGQTVANGTSKSFLILPAQGDPANGGQVVVTHSFITSVTYKLTPLV
jgi:hypothetical protein